MSVVAQSITQWLKLALCPLPALDTDVIKVRLQIAQNMAESGGVRPPGLVRFAKCLFLSLSVSRSVSASLAQGQHSHNSLAYLV